MPQRKFRQGSVVPEKFQEERQENGGMEDDRTAAFRLARATVSAALVKHSAGDQKRTRRRTAKEKQRDVWWRKKSDELLRNLMSASIDLLLWSPIYLTSFSVQT
ncbi:hypothetical protein HPP92_006088 [Vanilla planifolia]|uniref:Uncharacterized protein n=1 Tax=Vanilla planifolia TaxID=51239 RepID=A0A835RQS5_VANPL|nr:hypothetical protein HPP92_006088 [Vanilla planifolia]